MQNERKRILNMLENGTISTDEALTLLEALSHQEVPGQQTGSTAAGPEPAEDGSQEQEQEQTQQRSQQQEEPKSKQNTSGKRWDGASADEFMEDLRRDLSQAGEQFMQFMQTAVQKVKQFDMENPFGNAVAFEHTVKEDGKDIEELILDIDNGKCSIIPGEGDEITAAFSVKTFTSQTEEEAKREFLDKLVCTADAQSFHVASSSKMVQVNTMLTVPSKLYRKISVRMLNGGFDIRNLEADTLRVKTANGKVSMSYVKCREAAAETLNGEIRLLGFDANELDAQTVNGLVYVDGKVKETTARTLNGSISVTTTHDKADKIDVKSVGGNIELYVPNDQSLVGNLKSSIGSISVKLPDVEKTANQEQLLHRSMNFKKETDDSKALLHTFAESKTGSILVCYNSESK
ncbi:DUF4097 family beta strand repeat-containing protein [Sporosarcina trichiuri]|uniref:DUF4097 family beta strand repeat-containing protein n=1 Tax=Sporosarcina trichiuri TaxID=3056445 RepID=UPI0025B45D31|nr:DUF4097 family beta strand repeat-containing protein [Sporosarcina sp. 0.2-SM1T-5]WJY27715.1 DUF4097 family beta strand repeat-containing protein [Sporosarcina sp. 0.2-SM1T-5]